MPETEKPPVDRYSSPSNKFKAPDGKTYTITPKEKIFCDVYLETGGNKTIAALEAYEIANKDLCKIRWRELGENDKVKRRRAESVAATMGGKKVRKGEIKAYIDTVLENKGWVDKEVRVEHFKNIKQSKQLGVKNTAIDMYFKLKGEYAATKVQHGIDDRMEAFLAKQDKRLK